MRQNLRMIKGKRACLLLVLLSVMALVTGCLGRQEQSETLTVSVAASLTDCMEAVREAFNQEYPEIELQFNFGSSGALQQQIEQGAPVDLFFSAGMAPMMKLEEEGLLVSGSMTPALKNRLALIVPANSTKSLTFETLKEANLETLAIGEITTVPAGQYTWETFESLKIADKLQPILVYAKDVREVLSWVETGNAAAGVVYETDAKISNKVKISDLAEDSLHSPIIYPVAIMKNTQQLENSKLFVSFLNTETATAIFEAFGFTPIF